MKGFALPELVIAMLVLGIALVPLAGVFTQGKLRANVSAVQYAALVAGRAELEELRQVEFDQLKDRAHEWRSGGHLFRMTVVSPFVKNDPRLQLPREYSRIETALEIKDEAAPGVSGLKRATLKVRWQENGDTKTRAPDAISTLTTLIGSHHVLRGVR